MNTEYVPLTAETLGEWVKEQQEIEAGITEDCDAIESMIVRLAGPTLSEIETDSSALAEMQQKLSESIYEGVKKDTSKMNRIVRKLITPIDTGIAKDTTSVTGILARAPGSPFPANRTNAPAGGMHPVTNGMGTGAKGGLTRPSPTPNRGGGMGRIGPSPDKTAGGNTQSGEDGESPVVVSYTGLPNLKAAVAETIPPPAEDFVGPVKPEVPDLTVRSGAYGGNEVVLGGGGYYGGERRPSRPSSPLPAPPPPLPPPPAPDADPMSRLLRCCEAIAAQLSAVAQALYYMRPDTVRARPVTSEDDSAIDESSFYQWVDPPDQYLTDPDLAPAAPAPRGFPGSVSPFPAPSPE